MENLGLVVENESGNKFILVKQEPHKKGDTACKGCALGINTGYVNDCLEFQKYCNTNTVFNWYNGSY